MHIHILSHTYPHINTLIIHTHTHTLIKDQRPQRDAVISPKGPAVKGNKHKSQLSANEPQNQDGAEGASPEAVQRAPAWVVERGPDLS